MAMQNKYNQFFNFFLFSGLACFSYLSLVLYTDLTPQHQKILISSLGFISVVFIFNLVGFSLIVINRWLKKSSLFFIKKRNKLIINCILIAAILFFMNYATLTICKVLLELPFPFVLSSPGLRLIMIIWLVEIVIVSLSITSAFYRQLVILHEKTTKLEESSIKAQYTALQNQLNPHFLFNSLNTLISEIEYNPENAVVFTQKLSDVYRYILKSQEQGLVTLRDELEFLDSYIYLHQVRLGKCIQLENKMTPTLLNKKIPSLTLQLLIENVIKHNIINMENPMVIHLDYSDKDQTLSGISFAFIEQAQPESMIIFTTAYDEYAIRAFTVNSIDYLLKPINRERLAEAIEKFERLTARYGNTTLSNSSNELLNLLKNISNPEKKYRTRFLISGDEKLYTLQVEDIAYFYSENKITFAVTKEGKEHIIDLSLDKLSEQLNPDIFFRTNRQTLVSVHAIQKIENYFLGKIIVQVKPPFKDKITVSREKIAAMKLWLNY